MIVQKTVRNDNSETGKAQFEGPDKTKRKAVSDSSIVEHETFRQKERLSVVNSDIRLIALLTK